VCLFLLLYCLSSPQFFLGRFSLPEGGLTTYDSYPERTLPDGRVSERESRTHFMLKFDYFSRSGGGSPFALPGHIPHIPTQITLFKKWYDSTDLCNSPSTIPLLRLVSGATCSWVLVQNAVWIWNGYGISSIPKLKILSRGSSLANCLLEHPGNLGRV
jgi:hypothetical protein